MNQAITLHIMIHSRKILFVNNALIIVILVLIVHFVLLAMILDFFYHQIILAKYAQLVVKIVLIIDFVIYAVHNFLISILIKTCKFVYNVHTIVNGVEVPLFVINAMILIIYNMMVIHNYVKNVLKIA